ncbi:Nitronate monooxygenase [Hondaea fermentalgiana]|uniref:Nitronate monooxygenase n=1 Tax=Hondaea fermentalgiana TaxID=2315210 RepID=A0A2R5G6S1_9STRA|nr:Nitronate monooxygenase [Hondaea fermentalgiana]|eukprot:GBG26746.1 Nitronate monooxygenase [Hondaea fermentalgiana]
MGVFRTRVTELLGIEHPVICGGMTGVGTVELCAAVSEAGGLGMLTALRSETPENLRRDIERVRKLTSKPFGVNLTILPAMVPPDYEGFADAIIESGVKIVETAGNNPKKWVGKFKAAGLICIHKCVTIRHALSAERIGVDIISMDSFECAGHPGEEDIGAIVLLAKAAKKLRAPFVASGGIGDGKQLAAAIALGAEGVNMGTRFCATKECNWPESFKQRMVDAQETDTVLMFRALHNTARVFKNRVASEVDEIQKAKGMDLDFSDIAHLVAGTRGREAERNGDADGGIWTAGQVIGLIDDLPTVKELMDNFIGEAESTIRNRMPNVLASSRL